MKKLKTAIAVIGLFVCNYANASLIQLDEGKLFSADYRVGGMGTGRGIAFEVTNNFQMSQLGIDIKATPIAISATYEFEVFSSFDGHSVGAFLDSVNFNLLEGIGWVDVPFDFDFQSGNFYVINFSRVDNKALAGLGTHYSWEPSSHYDYGNFNIVEGFEGAIPNSANPLSAHFRIQMDTVTVPEPTTFGIFILSILGIAQRRYSKG